MPGTDEAGGRALRCECGYVAHGRDEHEFVAAALAHAAAAHRAVLTPELVLRLEAESSRGASPSLVRSDPEI